MKTWIVIALVMLLGTCLWNVTAMIARVPPPSRVSPVVAENNVVRHEARMAAARRAMGRHGARGKVGYLADLSPDALAADARGMEEYFLTQFALSPHVLDPRGVDCEWVVANLHMTVIEERIPPGYRILENCGGGVWLLRRETRIAP